MTHATKKLDNSQVEITITVTPEECQPHMEKAAVRISEKMAIKGFRKGKAPYDIVKKEAGEMAILQDALETIVQKTVLMKNKTRQEKIHSAVEIKKGKQKDVTQKYINQAYKDMQKAARERKKAKDKNKGDEEHGGRSMELSLDEMFPFSEKNKDKYDFALLEETAIEGIPVYVLDAKAKQRTKDYFDGIFYINKETWDILRAELQLAKNPGPLKVMEMKMDFEVLPQGYFTLKKIYVRIHVGLVVKNIRQEVVDEYSDYQILE